VQKEEPKSTKTVGRREPHISYGAAGAPFAVLSSPSSKNKRKTIKVCIKRIAQTR
jgi:hypothetical protein